MAKVDDASVFEESVDDAHDRDVLAQAFDAWFQAADASDIESDHDPCAAGAVHGLDDFRVDHRIELGIDK